jgi:hypothetical protein
MTMQLRMVVYEDGGFGYRGSCTRCSFVSGVLDDEDATYWQWMGHDCQ